MFTLVRKVDLNYATNRMILLFSLIAGVIGYLITGSFSSGFSIAGGTFLTWALTREVDPKHEYSAFFSASLSLVNLCFFERYNLLILFWILLLLRMVSGVCGKKLTLADFVVVFGFSAYLSVRSENSIYLIPFFIASASLLFYKEKPRTALFFTVLAAAVFLVESFTFSFFSLNEPAYSPMVHTMIAAVLALFPFFIQTIGIAGVLDDQGKAIHIRRVQFSQRIFSVVVLLLYLYAGMGLNNLILYLSVLAGIAAYALFSRIQRKMN